LPLSSFKNFSASLGLFQKSGANEISVSFATSAFLLSMSKIPPQRIQALFQFFIFFLTGHILFFTKVIN